MLVLVLLLLNDLCVACGEYLLFEIVLFKLDLQVGGEVVLKEIVL